MKLRFTIVPLILILMSCSNGQKPVPDPAGEPKTSDHLVLSREQIRLAGIDTGSFKKHIVSPVVSSTGIIAVPPRGMATITAPMGGYIQEANFYTGNYVEKGTILAKLKDPDYIRLQQDYLESRSRMEFLREEFKRQGELTLEDAASLKKLQAAESDFKTEEARMLSLEAQLKMIGMDPERINEGGIITTISLKAPISGYITALDANLGKYVKSGAMVYEIVDTDQMHLHLKVYESNLQKVASGQEILFQINGQAGECRGKIHTVGHKIDEDRTVTIYAHISDPGDCRLVPGLFVQAEILTQPEERWVLPEEAIASEGDSRFCFIAQDRVFIRKPIKTGTSYKGYVAVFPADTSIFKAPVVVRGAYYLQAEYTDRGIAQ